MDIDDMNEMIKKEYPNVSNEKIVAPYREQHDLIEEEKEESIPALDRLMQLFLNEDSEWEFKRNATIELVVDLTNTKPPIRAIFKKVRFGWTIHVEVIEYSGEVLIMPKRVPWRFCGALRLQLKKAKKKYNNAKRAAKLADSLEVKAERVFEKVKIV